MIKIKELVKSYRNNQVLKNINLSFDPGFIYGIVGRNGAGKTTLFNCICGFENYEGEIKTSLNPIKNHIGYLATDPLFLSYITGREYLRFVCNARGIHNIDFDKNNIFDLPLDQYATQYSTGMQKKLALLGILLQRNQIYILDEPFNGVDLQSNLIIIELIKKLKSVGKLVILSSHIFDILRNCCDQIIRIDQGKIADSVYAIDFDKVYKQMKKNIIEDKVSDFEV